MVALVGAFALVLGGCGPGGEDARPSAPPADARAGSDAPSSVGQGELGTATVAPDIEALSTDLVPSGWTLFGAPAYEQRGAQGMVADGAGQVWLRGPWQLTRLEPDTGKATMWDAADDLQFAAAQMLLAPAAGSGVWLLDGPRVRLFDGERFVVDLEVPEDIRNIPGGPESDGWVTDVVQAGYDLWVSVLDLAEVEDADSCCWTHPSSGGQVARLSRGRWTVMSRPGEGVGGDLAVDRDGAVWAGGVDLNDGPDEGKRPRRWDGHSWSLPGQDSDAAPKDAGWIVADPIGGVWFLNVLDGPRHFDGSSWTVHPASAHCGAHSCSWLAVAPDGAAWFSDEGLAVRAGGDGTESAYGPEAGVERASGLSISTGGSVLVNNGTSVLRLEGGRFLSIWQPQPAATRTTLDSGYDDMAVYAPSSEEVWVNTGQTWYRFRDGGSERLGAGSPSCLVDVGTDGALWTASETGTLARITQEGGYRVVATDPVDCGGGLDFGTAKGAGPDGSLWALQGGSVVRFMPDGSRVRMRQPVRLTPRQDCNPEEDDPDCPPADRIDFCLYGVDPTGALWVRERFAYAEDSDPCAGPWHRWDGRRWRTVEEPGKYVLAAEKVVNGDGIGWALMPPDYWGAPSEVIARYAEGRLNSVAANQDLTHLTPASGGRACAFEYPQRSPDSQGLYDRGSDQLLPLAIVCFDTEGEFARYDVEGLLDSVSQFSVAPDGSIWLIGPQVARLPQKLPAP